MYKRLLLILLTLFATFMPADTASASSGVISSLPTADKTVALTFDDGPNEYEPQILDVLSAEHVQATFFWIGNLANAKAAERVIQQGSSVQNHSYDHSYFQSSSYQTIYTNLSHAESAIKSASGNFPLYFRPPYGYINHDILQACSDLGVKPVTWNVDSTDWAHPNEPDVIKQIVYRQVQPGSIILFHEKKVTAGLLGDVIEHLKAQGYSFTLLPGLQQPPVPQVDIQVNGSLLQVKGQLVQDSTIVPLRAILEPLGVQVIWQDDGTIDLLTSEKRIRLKIGERTFAIMNRSDPVDPTEGHLPLAPYIEHDVTMAPLRSIAEVLGAQVNWSDNHVSLIMPE